MKIELPQIIKSYEAHTGKQWKDLNLMMQMHYAWGYQHAASQINALWELSNDKLRD